MRNFRFRLPLLLPIHVIITIIIGAGLFCTASTALAQNTKGDRPANNTRPSVKKPESQKTTKQLPLFSRKAGTVAKPRPKRKVINSRPKSDTPSQNEIFSNSPSSSKSAGDQPYRGGRTASGKRIVTRKNDDRSVNIYPRPNIPTGNRTETYDRAASVPLPSSGKGYRQPIRKDIPYRGPSASGRPVITQKQETKPPKFYPAKGPYVRSSAPKSTMRQVAGDPVKIRRLPLSNQERKVNRLDVIINSLSGNYISNGRKNPYAFKVQKPNLPAGSDLSGRPLRRLNYRSPRLAFVTSDTLKHANIRPKADVRSDNSQQKIRSASRSGSAWSGDITGRKLKTKFTNAGLRRPGFAFGRILSEGVASGQGLPLKRDEKKFKKGKALSAYGGKGNRLAKQPKMYSYKAAGMGTLNSKDLRFVLPQRNQSEYTGKFKMNNGLLNLPVRNISAKAGWSTRISNLKFNSLSGNRFPGASLTNNNKVRGSFNLRNRSLGSLNGPGIQSLNFSSSRNRKNVNPAGFSRNPFLQKSPRNNFSDLSKKLPGTGLATSKVEARKFTPQFLPGSNKVNIDGEIGKISVGLNKNAFDRRLAFSAKMREWRPTSYTGALGYYKGSAAFVKNRSNEYRPKPGRKNYRLAMLKNKSKPMKLPIQLSARRLAYPKPMYYRLPGLNQNIVRTDGPERRTSLDARPKIKLSGKPGNTVIRIAPAKLQIKDRNFSTHPDSKILLSAGAMGYQGSRYFVTGRVNPKPYKPNRADVSIGRLIQVNPNFNFRTNHLHQGAVKVAPHLNYNRFHLAKSENIHSPQVPSFYKSYRVPVIPDYKKLKNKVAVMTKYDRARIYLNGQYSKRHQFSKMNYEAKIAAGQLKPRLTKPKKLTAHQPVIIPDYGQRNIVGSYSGDIRQRPKVIPEYILQKYTPQSPWLIISANKRRAASDLIPKVNTKVYLDPGYNRAGMYRLNNGNERWSRVGFKDQYQTGRVALLMMPGKGTIHAAVYTESRHRNPFRNPWVNGPESSPNAIKLRRPDDRAFAVNGLQIKFKSRDLIHTASADANALPIQGRKLSARTELQAANPGKRQDKFVHSELADQRALKVQDPNQAFIRTALMQSNIKMKKVTISGLHPDATFLRDREQNASGERSVKTGIKLVWAKLFRKAEYQPANLKEKPKKARYDSREIGIWYD